MRQAGARIAGTLGAAVLGAVIAGAWYAQEPRIEAASAVAASASATSASTAPGSTAWAGTASAVGADAPASYADLVDQVAPAVVTIRSQRSVQPADLGPFGSLAPFFGPERFGPEGAQPRRQRGLGSGVVVDPDGYILTNYHVVERADRLQVELSDRRTFDATVVGSDEPTDLALLRIDATNLVSLPLADSDRVRVGDVVLAIGNPLGVGQTVTMGIVSATGRTTGASEGAFEDFIQTDAPINQGNSGGALVDTNGALVGINSQILSPVGYSIGIGFAIPSNMASDVMAQLRETGTVRRGMLGVTVQEMTPDLAASFGLHETTGAVVTGVEEGSPAARAGLAVGDIVLALDGRPVAGGNDLRNAVAPLGPGARVQLTVLREGRERSVAVTLAERPGQQADADSTPAGAPAGRYGMTLRPLTPEVARGLGIDVDRGVVVAAVDPSGRAADAGVEAGDVIEQLNGQPVADVSDVRRALGGASDVPARMLVNRRGSRLFLALPVDRG